MEDHKQPVTMQLSPDVDTFDNSLPAEKRGTGPDQYDMQRMGKTQETKVSSLSANDVDDGSILTQVQRNFRFLTIWGFTMVLMATWEAQFTASSFALLNGGTAGAIYVYIGAFAGFFLAICSMAEIASMAPTTGGQYRESTHKAIYGYKLTLDFAV